jgi:hypothetical protein
MGGPTNDPNPTGPLTGATLHPTSATDPAEALYRASALDGISSPEERCGPGSC